MALTVPVSVTVEVPLPLIPAVPPETVRVPLVIDKVTVSLAPPASTSEMLRPVIALVVFTLVL